MCPSIESILEVRPHDPAAVTLWPVDGDVIPDDFASQLDRLLAPGDAAEAGRAIAAATALDDERLAEFLEALATRIAASAEPITAAELRELLTGVVRSRWSASRDSSQ